MELPSALDVSTKRVICVADTAPLGEAAAIMFANKFRHLPVVNQKGNLVGIISQRPGPFTEMDWNTEVRERMTAPVEIVYNGSSLSTAIQIMLDKKISALVVVNEAKDVVGILTSEDVMRRFLIELQKEESKIDPHSIPRLQLVGSIMHSLAAAGI